jgi:hypothetical protein
MKALESLRKHFTIAELHASVKYTHFGRTLGGRGAPSLAYANGEQKIVGKLAGERLPK